MKIILLANHFNTGGITSYLLTLTRSCVSQGHQVIVASSGGDMLPELEAAGARHVQFAFRVKCDVHPGLLGEAVRLARLVRCEKADVIHAQTRVTQMCAALASMLSQVPYVSTCHGFFRPHLGRRLLPLWGRKVIAISTPVEQHLRQDHQLKLSRIAFIPNGIDLNRFVPQDEARRLELRRQWGFGSEPLLGIIARLSDVKGHQFLIEAMPSVLKQFPTAKCLIIGDGPMERDLKARVIEGKLQQHVLFYPVVNITAEVLAMLDVFVMPSLQEGLGLSVLEAAAMGIPAVASRVGGLAEVVVDQVTGLLVPVRDPAALAGAILQLLSDPHQARVMGQRAREFVTAKYSALPMVKSTIALYQSVVQKELPK